MASCSMGGVMWSGSGWLTVPAAPQITLLDSSNHWLIDASCTDAHHLKWIWDFTLRHFLKFQTSSDMPSRGAGVGGVEEGVMMPVLRQNTQITTAVISCILLHSHTSNSALTLHSLNANMMSYDLSLITIMVEDWVSDLRALKDSQCFLTAM